MAKAEEQNRAGGVSYSQSGSPAMPLWPKLIVIVGAVLTAAGGVLALVHPASLVSGHDEINEAVRVYAGYLVSRNLAIAFLLIALLILGSRRALSQLMVLVGLIQLLDACMDCWEGRWMLVPGVLVLSILFLMGASRLSGHRLWTKDAWVP